jgi:hypothetical protein
MRWVPPLFWAVGGEVAFGYLRSVPCVPAAGCQCPAESAFISALPLTSRCALLRRFGPVVTPYELRVNSARTPYCSLRSISQLLAALHSLDVGVCVFVFARYVLCISVSRV